MERELDDFMLNLDGKDYNDKTLLYMLSKFPEEIARKSGKPVAFEISKMRGMTYEDGVWGNQQFTELIIYALVNGKYKRYFYASKPIFTADDGAVTMTQECESKDKSTMIFQKKFLHCCMACNNDVAKGVYGDGGKDEQMVKYFAELWKEEIA